MSRVTWEGMVSVLIKGTYVLLMGAIHILIARWLGPDTYGTYSFGINYASILSLVAIMGLDKYLIRKISSYSVKKNWRKLRGLMRRSRQYILASSILLAGLTLVLTAVLQSVFQLEEQLLISLQISMFLVPVMSLVSVKEAIMRGFDYVLTGQLTIQILIPFLFLSAIAALYVTSSVPLTNAFNLLLFRGGAEAIGLIITGLLVWYISPVAVHEAKPAFDSLEWLYATLPLMMVGVIRIFTAKMDVVMIVFLANSSLAGIYNSCVQLKKMLSLFLIAAIRVIGPKISTAYTKDDLSELQTLLTFTSQTIFFLSVPVALGFLIWGYEIINLVFGTDYVGGTISLKILTVGYLINVACGPVGWLLMMTDLGSAKAKIDGVVLIANFLLNALLIPLFGIAGAATATALCMAIGNLYSVWFAWKKRNVNSAILLFR